MLGVIFYKNIDVCIGLTTVISLLRGVARWLSVQGQAFTESETELETEKV